MTAPQHEKPSIPLTLGEWDRFDDLVTHSFYGAPTVTRYYTPRARLRRLMRRIARSPFAGDLRAAVNAVFWPSAIGAGLLLGATLTVAFRGQYVSWSGWHEIPGATR